MAGMRLPVPLVEICCPDCRAGGTTEQEIEPTLYIRVTRGESEDSEPLVADFDVERLAWKRIREGEYVGEATFVIACPSCRGMHELRRHLEAPRVALRELKSCSECGGSLRLENEEIDFIPVDEERSEFLARATLVCDQCVVREERGFSVPVSEDKLALCSGEIAVDLGTQSVWIDGEGPLRGGSLFGKSSEGGRDAEPFSCFISYSHKDKDFAKKLIGHLRAGGIHCWLDEHELRPGEDIYNAVEHGIRMCDRVLLCCSRDSLASWWVRDEIDKAFEKERVSFREGKRPVEILIPLNLDNYLFDGWDDGRATALRRRLAANFLGWRENAERFREETARLILTLRGHLLSM